MQFSDDYKCEIHVIDADGKERLPSPDNVDSRIRMSSSGSFPIGNAAALGVQQNVLLESTYEHHPGRRFSDHLPPENKNFRFRSNSVGPLRITTTQYGYRQYHAMEELSPDPESLSPFSTSPSSLYNQKSFEPDITEQLVQFPDAGQDWLQPMSLFINTSTPSNSELLSPLSENSDPSPLESPRGRPRSPQTYFRRHSPYPGSRSHSSSRPISEAGWPSEEEFRSTSSMYLNVPQHQLQPTEGLSDHGLSHYFENMNVLSNPASPVFSDISFDGSSSDGVHSVPHGSPFISPSEIQFTEYNDPSNNQGVTPATLQNGYRPEVGSLAIQKAAALRRKKTGEFACPMPGCTATFTAKHNLQNHLNSHMGIRKFKCEHCGRDFGTSHVLARHVKKAQCERRNGSPS